MEFLDHLGHLFTAILGQAKDGQALGVLLEIEERGVVVEVVAEVILVVTLALRALSPVHPPPEPGSHRS